MALWSAQVAGLFSNDASAGDFSTAFAAKDLVSHLILLILIALSSPKNALVAASVASFDAAELECALKMWAGQVPHYGRRPLSPTSSPTRKRRFSSKWASKWYCIEFIDYTQLGPQ
jgi:hypothetical protein